ncbi:MAG TPA: YdeI/OmpD-associated family protein [Gemmataceae bacterium]|nr:YdeI/OmpD-associated family protein [Gemmataceae bacterium]
MPRKPARDDAPVIAFRDASAFEAWLDEHVDLPAGVWLKLARKGSGVPSLTDDEAVDIGLCYGWISGQRKSHDEVYYLQKYVPRRPRSRWSQVNVAKVEQLLAAGRMRPSGLAEVEAARADGRWAAAYEPQRNATVPPDLAAALAARPRAARAFGALGRTQRYAVILKLLTARTPRARAVQLGKALTALERRKQPPRA